MTLHRTIGRASFEHGETLLVGDASGSRLQIPQMQGLNIPFSNVRRLLFILQGYQASDDFRQLAQRTREDYARVIQSFV